MSATKVLPQKSCEYENSRQNRRPTRLWMSVDRSNFIAPAAGANSDNRPLACEKKVDLNFAQSFLRHSGFSLANPSRQPVNLNLSAAKSIPVPSLESKITDFLIRPKEGATYRKPSGQSIKRRCSSNSGEAMTFNEANTVEAFIRDPLCGCVTDHTAVGSGLARQNDQLSGLAGTTSPTMTFLANPKKHSSRITFARHSFG